MLGGCTGVQEDEPLPKGAYIPQQNPTAEEQPEVPAPEQPAPQPAVPETAPESAKQQPIITEPAEKVETPAMKPQKGDEKPAEAAPVQKPVKGERLTDIEYTVKKGDSYWKIAKMYGVSPSELAAYNKIAPEKLTPGKKILIPATGKKISAAAVSSKPVVKVKKSYEAIPADGIYVVKKGDSFYKIAQKFGIPAKTIAEYNNIPLTKTLQVNQKLKLPAKNAAAAAPKQTEKPAVDAAKTAEPAAAAPAASAVPATDAGSLDEIAPPSLDDVPAAPASGSAAPAAVAPAAAANEAITQEVISEDTTVANLAKVYGFTEAEIRAKNPGLPADGTVKRGTTIIMP